MSKLPREYFFFIASSIISNKPNLKITSKDYYSDKELMKIFSCKSKKKLKEKFNSIELDTIKSLNLPDQESYSIEFLAEHLDLDLEVMKKRKPFKILD